MGCAQTREISIQQRAIIIAQNGLGFQIQNSSRVDFIIRKYSSQTLINQKQFTRILSQLHLPLSNYSVHTKISSFYNRLKLQQTNQIYLQDMLILGILLSFGTSKTKSRLLFQAFDQQLLQTLSIQYLKQEAFPKIAKISLLCSNLVNNGQSQFANQLKIRNYIQDLKLVQEDAINRVCQKLLKPKSSQVTEKQFVQGLQSIYGGSLTTATGWRSYLHQIYKTSPPLKAFVNPFASRKKNLNQLIPNSRLRNINFIQNFPSVYRILVYLKSRCNKFPTRALFSCSVKLSQFKMTVSTIKLSLYFLSQFHPILLLYKERRTDILRFAFSFLLKSF